jgi:hypothetical protein
MFQSLAAAADNEYAMIDSTIVRARPCCTDGARKPADANIARVYAIRTEFRRANASIRFEAAAAMATSLASV